MKPPRDGDDLTDKWLTENFAKKNQPETNAEIVSYQLTDTLSIIIVVDLSDLVIRFNVTQQRRRVFVGVGWFF